MTFDDIVALLKQSFGLELKVVEGTTVFEVVSEDGGTKVKVLMQNVGEYNKVLLSADLGEPPQAMNSRQAFMRAHLHLRIDFQHVRCQFFNKCIKQTLDCFDISVVISMKIRRVIMKF